MEVLATGSIWALVASLTYLSGQLGGSPFSWQLQLKYFVLEIQFSLVMRGLGLKLIVSSLKTLRGGRRRKVVVVDKDGDAGKLPEGRYSPGQRDFYTSDQTGWESLWRCKKPKEYLHIESFNDKFLIFNF